MTRLKRSGRCFESVASGWIAPFLSYGDATQLIAEPFRDQWDSGMSTFEDRSPTFVLSR
jgi:hypothetical protein